MGERARAEGGGAAHGTPAARPARARHIGALDLAARVVVKSPSQKRKADVYIKKGTAMRAKLLTSSSPDGPLCRGEAAHLNLAPPQSLCDFDRTWPKTIVSMDTRLARICCSAFLVCFVGDGGGVPCQNGVVLAHGGKGQTLEMRGRHCWRDRDRRPWGIMPDSLRVPTAGPQ
jgi:hypothetical protein